MSLSALDPDLLIYKHEDWQTRGSHFLERVEALTLHRRMVREYGQKIAMSDSFSAIMLTSFPWEGRFRVIGELRDLREFMLFDLQKTVRVSPSVGSQAALLPSGLVCRYAESDELFDAWSELLCGCVDEEVLAEFTPQIAGWRTSALPDHSTEMTLTIHDSATGEAIEDFCLPLLWDEQGWYRQLNAQEWWPNLKRCVELHFEATPGMKDLTRDRQEPAQFECTSRFCRNVDRYCGEDESLRRSLVRQLTKKVYGIRDVGLSDEPFREVRRFRVTDDFRVHYCWQGALIVLLEFGHHDIGDSN